MTSYKQQLDPELLKSIKLQLVEKDKSKIEDSLAQILEQEHKKREKVFQDILDVYNKKLLYHKNWVEYHQIRQTAPVFETQSLAEIDCKVTSTQKEKAIFFEESLFEAGVGYIIPRSTQTIKKRENYYFCLSLEEIKSTDANTSSRERFYNSLLYLDSQTQETFWRTGINYHEWTFPADDKQQALLHIRKIIERKLELSVELEHHISSTQFQTMIDCYAEFIFEYAQLNAETKTKAIIDLLPHLGLQAKVRSSEEERIIDKIKACGGKLVPYEIDFPSYNSKLDNIQTWKWTLQVGKSTVNYIPSRLPSDFIAQKVYKNQVNQVNLHIDSNAAGKMRDNLRKKMQACCVSSQEMAVIQGPEGEERIVSYSSVYVSSKTREIVQEAIASGCPVDIPPEFIANVPGKCKIRQAQEEETETLDESWIKLEGGWFYGAALTGGSHGETYLQVCMDYQKAIDSVEGKEYTSSWEDGSNDLRNVETKKIFCSNLQPCSGKSEADNVAAIIHLVEDGFCDDIIQVESQSKLPQAMQQTPLSEQYSLIIENASSRESTDILKQLGCIQEVAKSVPYNKVYSSPDRSGPLSQKHPDYLHLSFSPRLPADCMVTHGMTGVKDEKSALERFENIVQAGGLRSIAQRRHAGTKVHSLSPIGDILSGIDDGVPASIGSQGAYRDWIVFAFKPSIIERKHVWFAPRDYGGGHNRFDEFDSYARGIGQEGFRSPPSHQARQKHLSEGVIGHEDNEVYFAGGVRWDEIDTVYIKDIPSTLTPDTSFYQELQGRIQLWKQSGLLPEDLKVDSFEDNLQNKIKSRAQSLSQTMPYWNEP